MATVACRACKGSGRFYAKSGKSFDCRACGGSGINKELWSTRCDRCSTEIIYKAYSTTPRFCKNCREIQLEKSCAQSGCTNTIRYKVGWSNISTYCKRCETKHAQRWSASTCPGTGIFRCGKLIWSPPGKRFNLCPDCSTRKKAEDAAKWQEKSCSGLKGQSCGKTIRYRVDWDKVPDICPDCREKAKQAKAEREAKKREKPCAGGCGRMIQYNIDWEHPPNFCNECKEKRSRKHESNQSENPRFYAACGHKGANLSQEEIDRFSEYFHDLPDRQRMSFNEIAALASEWKQNNGGGFRRSDRR